MHTLLRRLFGFILQRFEGGTTPYTYKPLHRKLLIIVGFLFMALCLVTVYFALGQFSPGYLIPILVFFSIALVCLVIGLLGTERAVASLWGNR